MCNVNDFWVNKGQGDIGEAIVSRWLGKHGFSLKYNLKDDKRLHVDRYAVRDDVSFTLDAKHCYNIGHTKNIAFEVQPNPTKTGLAAAPWGLDPNNKSEYLFIVDGTKEKEANPPMWIVRLADVRTFYLANKSKLSVKKQCALIPLAEFG